MFVNVEPYKDTYIITNAIRIKPQIYLYPHFLHRSLGFVLVLFPLKWLTPRGSDHPTVPGEFTLATSFRITVSLFLQSEFQETGFKTKQPLVLSGKNRA